MKAIAKLKRPIPHQDKQLIIDTLTTIMDIGATDLDIENGILFFQYRNRLALDLVERKLSEIGHPIISYSYPIRRPLNFNGNDPGHSFLA